MLFRSVDSYQNITVISEIYETGLLVSQAAELMKKAFARFSPEAIFAPPDLWGRNAETGRSIASLFVAYGITLTRVAAARVSGWIRIKESLESARSGKDGRLIITNNCINLLRTLPSLIRDTTNPSDISITPHELTHIPDALRYLFSGIPMIRLSSEPIWSDLF